MNLLDLLVLTVGSRPDPGFPDAWLDAARPRALLHLYVDRPMPMPAPGGDVI